MEDQTLDAVHPARLYSMAEVAKIVGIHPDTAYRIPRTLLKRTPIGPRGGRTKVLGRDLLAYLGYREAA